MLSFLSSIRMATRRLEEYGFKYFKLLRFPRSKGIFSSNLLYPNRNVCNMESFPSYGGIFTVRLFLERPKYLSWARLLYEGGIILSKKIPLKSRCSSKDNKPISS